MLMRLWGEGQGTEPGSEPCLQAELGLVYGCVGPIPLARPQAWAAPPASNITADEKPVTSMVREPQWRHTVAVIVNGPLGRTMFRCPILTQRVINLPRQSITLCGLTPRRAACRPCERVRAPTGATARKTFLAQVPVSLVPDSYYVTVLVPAPRD